MKIHALIAEDEELAREELVYLLKKESDIVIDGSVATGEEVISLYQEHESDLVFLDVQMPGMSGVEAAKQISRMAKRPPSFIFTTAYEEYAVDAFDMNALDYLLKPYDEKRLEKALERAREQMEFKKQANQQEERQTPPSKLLIDDGDKTVVISPQSIYYAEPTNRVLTIHTKDKVIQSRMTLQELEKKLEGLPFFRPHRSYLVNLDYIEEITPWFNGTSNIKLSDKNNTVIPVSRAVRKELFKKLEN